MENDDIVCKTLGEGGFGKVLLVEHEGELLARKEIKFARESIEEAEEEIKILKKLNDRKVLILKDYKIIKSENKCYIYTEYMKNGDLKSLINRRMKMKEDFRIEEVMRYIKELIKGLKYLHIKKIIHRDLKPENILIGDYNELIISDFGLAIEIEKSDYDLRGTVSYMAPELFNKKPPPYSCCSDIYSLGCIIYEIYTLRMLHKNKNQNEIINEILSKNEIDYRRKSGERNLDIEKLISMMLEKDVNKRIKLNEIEEEIDNLSSELIFPSRSLPSIQNNSSSTSLPFSTITTTSELASASSYDSCLAIMFYLKDRWIKGKTLKEIVKMNSSEFELYWKDEYMIV